MARKTVVQWIDDLDRTEVKAGGRTVTFAIENVQYEIDLSDGNAQKLHAALAPFIAVARPVGARAERKASTATRADPAQQRAVRRWAKEHGISISDRGRIPLTVQNAYQATH